MPRIKRAPHLSDDALLAYLLSRAERMTNGCLEWRGGLDSDGYGQTTYEGRIRLVHRVIWILTVGPISSSTICVLHECDNPPCIEKSHLYLGNQKQNAADKYARERANVQRGESIGTSKLTEAQVREIRELRESHTIIELAAMYRVTNANISNICLRKSWRHIDG